ncbi:MAG: acyl dehydratase [Betaproteobacteria bacterium RIFCSPLOWO2_12_FULL_62_58]|nr:MAG: acyl dehydratase [Betaproteobacteria bacterium RIFCSPLOWO2_12_FULL_62_58]
MDADILPLGHGLYFEELPLGHKFRTFGRTITEADLINFVNATGFTEVLFTDTEYLKTGSVINGRVVPAMMVYALSEGLVVPLMQGTGLAFFNATIDVKGPTFVGDTIHVEGEVIEARATSKGGSGLVRTMNRVVNQNGETVLTYNPLRMMKRRS